MPVLRVDSAGQLTSAPQGTAGGRAPKTASSPSHQPPGWTATHLPTHSEDSLDCSLKVQFHTY